MYLKSCCALFLLALVACQAAPSPKMIEKKSISEAETTFTKNDIKLEDSGAEKDRAKKSATTFCLEVRSGKQEQVPCRQEVKPQEVVHRQDKPVVVLQPISVSAPAPVIDYARQPIVIQQQLPQPQQQLPQPQQQLPQPQQQLPQPQQQLPQPQPQLQPQPQPQPQPQSFHVIQQQSSLANFNYPQPQVVPTYEPAPQQTQRIEPPAPAPAPVQTHTPIINIVPAAAPASCDKTTILQPPQPQQIHTVHVIHQQPQPQPTQRPSVTFIQEVKPNKEEKPIHKSPKPSLRPKTLPIPHQEISIVPIAPSYKTEVVAPARPLEFLVPRPYIEYVQSVKPQEEGYECSCRPENRIPTLTPYVTSRFPKVPESRVEYSSGAFESLPYYRSSMMSEDNPIIMPEQSMFYASEGAREAV